MEPRINLGDRAKDAITGFEGIVVARTEFINKCVRIQLQSSKLDKDGKPIDVQVFDEEQLHLVKAADVKMPKHKEQQTGGPRPDTYRAADTKR